MSRRRRRDPRLRHQLLALPLPLLEVQLAEAGDVFGTHVQPEAAERNALLAGVPGRILDAERLEQTRAEIRQDILAGDLLDDGGEHVARRRVVEEEGSRLVRDGPGEERFDDAVVADVDM